MRHDRVRRSHVEDLTKPFFGSGLCMEIARL
jgi:hypothetical protein